MVAVVSEYGFFPITAEEIETFWPSSSDVEKLYLYLLKAEFNYLQSDGFRRSDAWFAAALGCSVSAIRQARRRLQAAGAVEYAAGWRKAGKGLAGHYKTVSGVKVAEGIFWAQVGFYKLHMLLAQLRLKGLTRDDLVLWLLFEFFRKKFEVTGEDNFFLTKNQVRTATGFDDPVRVLRHLFDRFKYNNGDAHLFGYQIDYHKIRLSKFADPKEEEKTWDRWREEIKARAKTLDQPKPKPKPLPKPRGKAHG